MKQHAVLISDRPFIPCAPRLPVSLTSEPFLPHILAGSHLNCFSPIRVPILFSFSITDLTLFTF
jgi:hypothetical protein